MVETFARLISTNLLNCVMLHFLLLLIKLTILYELGINDSFFLLQFAAAVRTYKTPVNLGILFVPERQAWVVERLGKFYTVLNPVSLSFYCTPTWLSFFLSRVSTFVFLWSTASPMYSPSKKLLSIYLIKLPSLLVNDLILASLNRLLIYLSVKLTFAVEVGKTRSFVLMKLIVIFSYVKYTYRLTS